MGRHAIDLTGQRFGRLVAIERAGTIHHDTSHSYATWRCKCDCGNEKIVISTYLRRGLVRSCGCLRNELAQTKMKQWHARRKHNEHALAQNDES